MTSEDEPGRVTLRLHRPGSDAGLPPVAEMLDRLDEVERRRADRYATPGLAAPFIAGRYLLRRLAAGTVDAEPGTLLSHFSCPVCGRRGSPDDHGRPGYTVNGNPLPLALSLSRAPGALLLGALDLCGAPKGSARRDPSGQPTRIGVDLDAVSGVLFEGFDDIALSRAERHGVEALLVGERDGARARLWVRKEAVVKARGTGFAPLGPADVEVLGDPGSTNVTNIPNLANITDLTECDGVELAPLGLVAAVALL